MNDLLKTLHPYINSLPLNFDTMLKKETIKILPKTIVCTYGEYVYFGISTAISQIFNDNKQLTLDKNQLLLKFNIDGLQLYKSSSSSVWSIVMQIPCILDCPVLVGLYIGTNKPCHKILLESFIDELEQILRHGILKICDHNYSVNKVLVICDAPARAMIKQIKGHSGYFSCERCEVEGTYFQGAVCFDEISDVLRTDEFFRQHSNEEHHQGTSLFERLPIDMITTFVLDSMHLVSLGVMRRLLFFWLTMGPLHCRLAGFSQITINNNFLNLSSWLPSAFSRKPRPLSEIKKFKATEFHTILKYTGVSAFMNVVNDNVFKNYLLLHVGFTILSSTKFCLKYHQLATKCLREFFLNSKEQYGIKFCSYNVHSILHLSDDVFNHKISLNAMTSYPFENYYIHLKKSIKSPYLPVRQLIKHVKEGFFSKCRLVKQQCNSLTTLSVMMNGCQTFIPPNLRCYSIYKSLHISSLVLHSKLCDSFFSDKKNKIYQFLCAIGTPDEPTIIAVSLPNDAFHDLYTYPCNSSLLHIFAYNGSFYNGTLAPSVKILHINDVCTKFVCIPHSVNIDQYCFFPLNVNMDDKCEHCI